MDKGMAAVVQELKALVAVHEVDTERERGRGRLHIHIGSIAILCDQTSPLAARGYVGAAVSRRTVYSTLSSYFVNLIL